MRAILLYRDYIVIVFALVPFVAMRIFDTHPCIVIDFIVESVVAACSVEVLLFRVRLRGFFTGREEALGYWQMPDYIFGCARVLGGVF